MDVLDKLLEDAKRLAKERSQSRRKQSRAKTADPDSAYEQTKEELRKLALDVAVPTALVLRMTVQHCQCGQEYTSVNNVPLVKKEGKNFRHYTPPEPYELKTLEAFADLPKIIEVIHIDVPWCQVCFIQNPSPPTVVVNQRAKD